MRPCSFAEDRSPNKPPHGYLRRKQNNATEDNKERCLNLRDATAFEKACLAPISLNSAHSQTSLEFKRTRSG